MSRPRHQLRRTAVVSTATAALCLSGAAPALASTDPLPDPSGLLSSLLPSGSTTTSPSPSPSPSPSSDPVQGVIDTVTNTVNGTVQQTTNTLNQLLGGATPAPTSSPTPTSGPTKQPTGSTDQQKTKQPSRTPTTTTGGSPHHHASGTSVPALPPTLLHGLSSATWPSATFTAASLPAGQPVRLAPVSVEQSTVDGAPPLLPATGNQQATTAALPTPIDRHGFSPRSLVILVAVLLAGSGTALHFWLAQRRFAELPIG